MALGYFLALQQRFLYCSAIIATANQRQTGHGPAQTPSRPCPWPQVPSPFHENARKGHPRFFVRENHKGSSWKSPKQKLIWQQLLLPKTRLKLKSLWVQKFSSRPCRLKVCNTSGVTLVAPSCTSTTLYTSKTPCSMCWCATSRQRCTLRTAMPALLVMWAWRWSPPAPVSPMPSPALPRPIWTAFRW